MSIPGLILLLVMAAYWLGMRDGLKGRPAPPQKGTYEDPDADDRVDNYPDQWV